MQFDKHHTMTAFVQRLFFRPRPVASHPETSMALESGFHIGLTGKISIFSPKYDHFFMMETTLITADREHARGSGNPRAGGVRGEGWV